MGISNCRSIEAYNEAIRLTKEKVPIHELINFDKKIESPVKVSVVVPVCNVEQYLRECLDSCINQTLKDIEIICVNDGSKDGSLEILKEYAAKDSRVKVIDKDNAGYGHTMNIGMDMAVGEYIGIVESDDFVKLDMYETLYHIAKKDDIDVVKADYYRFTDEGGYRHLFYQFLSLKPELYDCVISDKEDANIFKFTNTWSGIYKKRYLDKYVIRHQETPGASYQDNGFWFQTTVSAEKIYYLSKPFYMNRRDNPNSSVYQKEKVFMATGEYAYIYEFLDKNPQLKQKFQKYYYSKKFDNYFYCYRQVAPEYRREFLAKFSDEFKNDLSKNEIDKTVFGESKTNLLLEIVEHPDVFYENTKNMDDVSYDLKISQEEVIPVVFICDNGYVIPTVTAICSMIKHKKKETKYDITIVAVSLSDADIRVFAAMQTADVNINIIYIKENLFNNLHSEEISQYGVSATALIKFLLPELMAHCDKILYLDGDIAVKRDLTELYSNDLDDCYAGVIRDVPQVLYKRQIFGRTYGRDYFNSGVMLLNVRKMREDNLTSALIENKKNSSSRLMDQDVFNEVFAGNVKQLSIVYNTLYVNLIRSKGKYSIEDINNYYGTEFIKLEDIRKSSNIIHYCSSDKPWKYYDVPMADFWLEHYFRSAYGNKRLIRASSLHIQSEAKGNGQICISDDENSDTVYPIVFYYNNNTKEILENITYISSLNKNNEKFNLYLFYKDGSVI
ncbi:MAG: glycosyltransferase, partial [Eubacterium sp.]|nr:glycosyltransferase [Eubacterium sp.]